MLGPVVAVGSHSGRSRDGPLPCWQNGRPGDSDPARREDSQAWVTPPGGGSTAQEDHLPRPRPPRRRIERPNPGASVLIERESSTHHYAGQRAVIKSSSRRWAIAVPVAPARRATSQAVCLFIADLGANIRFCRYPRVGCLLRRSLGSVPERVRLVRTAPIALSPQSLDPGRMQSYQRLRASGCRWVKSIGGTDWQRNGVAVTAL